jgi:hypothetical protein
MHTKMIVTDVTRMSGTRVCVGAITDQWESVRPVLPYPGIQEDWLHSFPNHVVKPFSRITLDLFEHISDPPHTEDWEFFPAIIDHRGELNKEQMENFLERILDPSVEAIFGSETHRDNSSYFVQHGEGNRSLGTIKVQEIELLEIYTYKERCIYKIKFTDESDTEYKLTVTDLAFRNFVDTYRNQGIDCSTISHGLKNDFKYSTCYLRIGLARAWHPDKAQPKNRCYLQITGVYSFPDYKRKNRFVVYRREEKEELDDIPF